MSHGCVKRAQCCSKWTKWVHTLNSNFLFSLFILQPEILIVSRVPSTANEIKPVLRPETCFLVDMETNQLSLNQIQKCVNPLYTTYTVHCCSCTFDAIQYKPFYNPDHDALIGHFMLLFWKRNSTVCVEKSSYTKNQETRGGTKSQRLLKSARIENGRDLVGRSSLSSSHSSLQDRLEIILLRLSCHQTGGRLLWLWWAGHQLHAKLPSRCNRLDGD